MRTVAVVLEGPLAVEVTAWAETEAGWHVSTVDGRPTPELVLAGAVLPGRATVVVVDGQASAEQVRRALQEGAVDVVSWPAERVRLREVLESVAERVFVAPGLARAPRVLAVAGAGGGAGTSTVALAVAGLLAWAGPRVLVVGGDDLVQLTGLRGWSGPGLDEILGLDPVGAAEEVGVLARPVAGVPRLRVLGRRPAGVSPGGPDGSRTLSRLARGWPADVVVVDLRTAVGGADLVIARPDRCLTGAGAAPVVVVGAGAGSQAAVRRLLGREPVAWLPHSARVARAGLAGRVPSALPGSWLSGVRAALAAVLAAGARQVAA